MEKLARDKRKACLEVDRRGRELSDKEKQHADLVNKEQEIVAAHKDQVLGTTEGYDSLMPVLTS